MRAEHGRELEFVATLGRGGFGAVYLAWLHGQKGWKRTVAVKVLHANVAAAPDLRARQWDEARLLGLLAHENIVQVVDVTEIDGKPAALMEYVEGVDLSKLLRHEGEAGRAVPARAALGMIRQAASALDAAWNGPNPATGQPLRVIHRDIKPANLLLTPNGGLKVLDFGIARADVTREAITGSAAFGTPRYMAPEQWRGEPLGPGADVYALGVTLYELLTRRPWDRPPTLDGEWQAQLDRMLVGVPEPAHDLVRVMCALDPANRPSAAEVVHRIEAEDGEGEPLSRYARRVVPPLVVELRKDDEGLPARMSLGAAIEALPAVAPLVHVAEPTVAAPTPSLGTGASVRTEPNRRLLGSPLRVVGVAAVLAVLGVGSAAVVRGLGERAAQSTTQASPATEPGTAGDRVAAVGPTTGPATTSMPTTMSTMPTTMLSTTGPAADVSPSPAATSSSPPATTTSVPPGPAASPRTTPSTVPSAPALTTASSGSASPAPSGAPATDTPAAADPPPPAEAPRHALKVLSDTLGANVYVDGELLGHTPTTLELVDGPHRVVIVAAGSRSPDRLVTIDASTRRPLQYDFAHAEWTEVLSHP